MSIVQRAVAPFVAGTANPVLNNVHPANSLILLCVVGSAASNTAPTTPTGFSVLNAPGAYYDASAGVSASATLFINQSPSSGTNSVSVSFNYSAGGGGYAELIECSGLLASAVDVAPAASNVTNAGTAGANSSASGTLASASEVVFVAFMENTSGSGLSNTGLNHPPTGFADIDGAGDTAHNWNFDTAYYVTNSTASVPVAYAWTDTSEIVSQLTIGSVKIAAGSWDDSIPAPTRSPGRRTGRPTSLLRSAKLDTTYTPPVDYTAGTRPRLLRRGTPMSRLRGGKGDTGTAAVVVKIIHTLMMMGMGN